MSSRYKYPVVAELLGDVCLRVVADVVGTPGGSVEQPLQAIEGAVASVFGQLSAVLAADRAEQGTDVVPHTASQVRAAEAVADAEEEVFEFTVPGRVRKVVDHVGDCPDRTAASSGIDSLEGRSAKTVPDTPSANYTPGNASRPGQKAKRSP